MEKILFTGPPGSGKGTQAKLLKKYGYIHLSSGDLIRNSKDSVIVDYRENGGYVKGKFLLDELIFKMLNEEISKFPENSKGYILDGFVRNIKQAKDAKKRRLLDKVFYFIINKNTSIERRMKRKEERTDDKPESMESRLEVYKKETEPILEYLKENFEFYSVDASHTIEEIHKEVKRILKLD
ncbi:hypothetical protein COU58_01320 [Candidatus Pacearchaeota archaeon CG10_big_fil_rev_8_21_14_0_10_32_42]|nr:MAG: hypothetical protein COU58_01320 [Candidatus Pacearchaeota archaeon CG10_big_fil_rev_8_21_14_0_10_32_42]